MITYSFARDEHRADIIDFINYIFSQSAEPHDFKTRVAKVYADGRGYADIHAIALDDGRVRGVVAQYPLALTYGGAPLNVGYIGSVSTYPYTRGSGHMIKLMDMQLKRAEQSGVDILLLGGQRQRYEYYGYTPCGEKYTYWLNSANARHALKHIDAEGVSFKKFACAQENQIDAAYALYLKQPVTGARPREDFELVLGTWYNEPYLILDGARVIGYMAMASQSSVTELILENVNDAARVFKAWFGEYPKSKLSITVPPYDEDLNRALSAFAEGYGTGRSEQARIINLVNVLNACLHLKKAAGALSDGCVTLQLEDEKPVRARVLDGNIEVAYFDGAPDIALKRHEMQAFLLSANRFQAPKVECPVDWFPLPLFMYNADHF